MGWDVNIEKKENRMRDRIKKRMERMKGRNEESFRKKALRKLNAFQMKGRERERYVSIGKGEKGSVICSKIHSFPFFMKMD